LRFRRLERSYPYRDAKLRKPPLMTWEFVLPPPWLPNPPASEDLLGRLANWATLSLPDDYLALLRWANGGEGPVGDVYLSIWRCESVSNLNEGYGIQTHLPEVIAIGDDSAHFYALRFGGVQTEVIRFPMGFVHPSVVVSPRLTLAAMFAALIKGELH
jgi:hypothetical protein